MAVGSLWNIVFWAIAVFSYAFMLACGISFHDRLVITLGVIGLPLCFWRLIVNANTYKKPL